MQHAAVLWTQCEQRSTQTPKNGSTSWVVKTDSNSLLPLQVGCFAPYRNFEENNNIGSRRRERIFHTVVSDAQPNRAIVEPMASARFARD